MTKVEALVEEIEKLTPEEQAQLRERMDAGLAEPRKKGKYTFQDIRRRLFPDGPPPYKSMEEMREAVDEDMRMRYGRP